MIFEFITSNFKDKNENFIKATLVKIEANNEKEAFKNVKKTIKRKHYFIKSIDTTQYLERLVDIVEKDNKKK